MRRTPHDTRRGAGADSYTSHPDFAAADAIEDTYATRPRDRRDPSCRRPRGGREGRIAFGTSDQH